MKNASDFMNMNPMMNMFSNFDGKKMMNSFEESMNWWKNFYNLGSDNMNFSNMHKHFLDYMNMFSDNLKSMFDNFVYHNDGDNEKHMPKMKEMLELFSSNMHHFGEATKMASKNAQEVAHKNAETFKHHANEVISLFKLMAECKKPEESMCHHKNFMNNTSVKILEDFKNLFEIMTKSNSEIFEHHSNKFHEHLDSLKKTCCNHSEKSSENCKSNDSKTKPQNPK